MKCKDVTAKIDLGQMPTHFMGRLGFALHFLHCRACRFYLKMSTLLGDGVRRLLRSEQNAIAAEKLTQDLLKKYL